MKIVVDIPEPMTINGVIKAVAKLRGYGFTPAGVVVSTDEMLALHTDAQRYAFTPFTEDLTAVLGLELIRRKTA